MNEVDETLKERGLRYGKFTGHGEITQAIKDVMNGWLSFHDESVESNAQRRAKWHHLRPDMKEGLEMIAHKIGRILNGDPFYKDSWIDIAGYAKLIADTLTEDSNAGSISSPGSLHASGGPQPGLRSPSRSRNVSGQGLHPSGQGAGSERQKPAFTEEEIKVLNNHGWYEEPDGWVRKDRFLKITAKQGDGTWMAMMEHLRSKSHE